MFKLKPAEEKDAAAIAAIQVNTWKDCYSGLMPEKFFKRLPGYGRKHRPLAEHNCPRRALSNCGNRRR